MFESESFSERVLALWTASSADSGGGLAERSVGGESVETCTLGGVEGPSRARDRRLSR